MIHGLQKFKFGSQLKVKNILPPVLKVDTTMTQVSKNSMLQPSILSPKYFDNPFFHLLMIFSTITISY